MLNVVEQFSSKIRLSLELSSVILKIIGQEISEVLLIVQALICILVIVAF